MSEQKLFFSAVKEDRGLYFIEYKPPNHGFHFATLCLVFPEPVAADIAAQAMEAEARAWLARYPVPVFVSSSDAKNDAIDLSSVRPCEHLMAFIEKGHVQLFWKLLTNAELPADALNPDYLRAIYAGIPCKTTADLEREAGLYAKKVRRGWLIVFLWACVIPASWEILQWAGPNWLAALVTAYGLWKAFKTGMILLGKWKKSPLELKKDEEEQRMRHYFYHCERNPEGFSRLKAENFERETRENTRMEALRLRQKP